MIRKDLIVCQLSYQVKLSVISLSYSIWLIRYRTDFYYQNGYSDLVLMSSELYDKFVKNNRIDQAIYESEKEMESGGVSIGLDEAF